MSTPFQHPSGSPFRSGAGSPSCAAGDGRPVRSRRFPWPNRRPARESLPDRSLVAQPVPLCASLLVSTFTPTRSGAVSVQTYPSGWRLGCSSSTRGCPNGTSTSSMPPSSSRWRQPRYRNLARWIPSGSPCCCRAPRSPSGFGSLVERERSPSACCASWTYLVVTDQALPTSLFYSNLLPRWLTDDSIPLNLEDG